MGRILRLQEGGFLEQWRTYWWPMTTECEPQAARVSEAKQIGLPKMAGLLVVYTAVVAVAMVCFLVTLCLYKTDTGSRIRKMYRRMRCKEEATLEELPPENDPSCK